MTVTYTKRLTTFFGDGKHAFELTWPMIVELERNTGTGHRRDLEAHLRERTTASATSARSPGSPSSAPAWHRSAPSRWCKTYVHATPIAHSLLLAPSDPRGAPSFGIEKIEQPQESAQ